ncbi:MAG: histidine kinase [Opitutaceae bacterium]|nr:histidine kinase [Opitutaceae bacterium]
MSASPIISFGIAAMFLAGAASAATSSPITPVPPPAVESAPLTTVAAAFARWPELTVEQPPVRIEGVVTGTMPSGAFRLHDGELGIFVSKSPSGQKLVPGDRVAVAGVLRKGGFSPWLLPTALIPLGRGPFPDARPASYSVLALGTADNQWLEIEGVVRSAELLEPRDFVAIDLGMEGESLRVLVNYSAGADLESLVDARVRMRGVAAVNVNKHGHVVEPSFRVPSFSEITMLRPPAPDPFAQPLVPVSRLMRLPPGETHRHRVRTSGVVTRRISDTTFFLRDGDLGLKVVMKPPVNFQSGDMVEAVGFPAMAEGLAVLQHAVARVITKGAPPPPVRPTTAELLGGLYNSDLVRIDARLVDWSVTGQGVTLILQSGDLLFKALYNHPPAAPLRLPEKNSLVTVTGICVISELEDIWFYQPRAFLLLVADAADVQLVQAPPWWTLERLWRALLTTGAILLGAAGLVWSLRRQIERKRAVIEQQTRHAAALEERTRIARELHDTLEQGLTGLSLQMKAMETDLNGTTHPVRARLQFARQMLRQSRALARNAIRELREEAVPARLEGLVAGLQRIAGSWNHSGALSVDIQVSGTVRSLPPRLENHLLGIGTEAMTNAVKHGRAETIHVQLDFRAAEVSLRIIDNGAGFEPAEQLDQSSGCFGLLGMRERAREIRGELRIESGAGRGTEILVTAPAPPVADGDDGAVGLPPARDLLSGPSAAT